MTKPEALEFVNRYNEITLNDGTKITSKNYEIIRDKVDLGRHKVAQKIEDTALSYIVSSLRALGLIESGTTDINNRPYNSFSFRGGDEGVVRQRGRSLVHCFGHMLGLAHPSTQLREPTKQCAGETNIFSDILNNTEVYNDNIADTEDVQNGETGVVYSTWYNRNDCSRENNTVFTSASNHMAISQKEGLLGMELGGPSTTFTAEQILWMHANCEIEFQGEEGFYPGILKEILIHSTSIIIDTDTDLDPDPYVDPCADISNVNRIEIKTEVDFKNIDDKVSIFKGLLNAIKKLKEHHQND